jgi:hypothetical protein
MKRRNQARAICVLVAAVVATGPVAPSPAAGAAASFSWGSCGAIAYNQEPAQNVVDQSQLMVVPAGGGTSTVLWNSPDPREAELDAGFSPDGKAVVFVGRVVDAANLQSPVNRLYVLRQGSAEPEIVVDKGTPDVDFPAFSRHPVWSPNGKTIAYASSLGPKDIPAHAPSLGYLHLFDLATKTDALLAEIPPGMRIVDLGWSPRGDRLVVTGYHLTERYYTVWSVRPNPADPQLTVLTTDQDGAQPVRGYATYVPGIDLLLIEQDDAVQPASRLYLTDTRFRHVYPVSPTPLDGLTTMPDFGVSPLQVAFARWRFPDAAPAEFGLEVLDLPSQTFRVLVPASADAFLEFPDWQPTLRCGGWPLTR